MARVQFNCWEWNLGFSEFTWRLREYPYNNKIDSQIKQLDNCQEELKAWLMVHGFEQKKKKDFVETFALVIKLMTN